MKIGFDCKLYRGDPLDDGAVSATGDIEVTTAKDVTLSHKADEVEASNRSSRYKKYLQGMIDGGIEVPFDYDTGDEHCMAFFTAALERKLLPLYVELDEGIGLDADFEIFMTNTDQPLAETEKITYSCKPSARAGREPDFVNNPPQA